jgi:hypothetical protein
VTEAEFREFLDAISDCFINSEFEQWEARIQLPFTLVTGRGPVVLADRAELLGNFGHYISSHRMMKLDLIVRRPIGLEDCKDGTFIGTFETELLAGGKRATVPYTSSALLHRSETGWRMSSILNARGHHEWTGILPLPTGRPQ